MRKFEVFTRLRLRIHAYSYHFIIVYVIDKAFAMGPTDGSKAFVTPILALLLMNSLSAIITHAELSLIKIVKCETMSNLMLFKLLDLKIILVFNIIFQGLQDRVSIGRKWNPTKLRAKLSCGRITQMSAKNVYYNKSDHWIS